VQLFALPDLSVELHERVLTQFWAPFNEGLKLNLPIRISPLVSLGKIVMVTREFPRYWGLDDNAFKSMIHRYDKWAAKAFCQSLSYDDWLSADDTHLSPSVVCIGEEVHVFVEVRNRFGFAITVHNPTLRASYEGSSTDNDHYRIISPPDQTIGGLTAPTAVLDFRLSPLAGGKFELCKFDTTLWSHINTTVRIRPLHFIAVEERPELTMHIDGFPTDLCVGDCEEFQIRIVNNGLSVIEQLFIVFDTPNMIRPLLSTVNSSGLNMVDVKQSIEPNGFILVPFIIRAESIGAFNCNFMSCVGSLRAGYAVASCTVSRGPRVSAVLFSKVNDTRNKVLHITVRCADEPLTFVGVMNTRAKLLKCLIPAGKPLLVGSALFVIAFTEEETGEECEQWRIPVMAGAHFSLLVDLPERKCHSQINLDVLVRNPRRRFRLEMDSSFILGAEIKCTVSLQNLPRNPNRVYYIDPKDISVLNEYAEEARRGSGCSWIGLTKQALSAANQFKATFSIISRQVGVYKVVGFKLYKTRDSGRCILLPLMNVFRVTDPE
jgi:hypothetical protein